MTDRTIVITGASDGVGAAAAEALAQRPNTQVVMVGRSPGKTKAKAEDLGGLEYHVVDFANLDDVRRLAADLAEAHPVIDVLANNAGGVFTPRTTTRDGFEKTFQVNHLAPYLLTTLLLDQLRAGEGIVINTASVAAFGGHVDLSDLSLQRRWRPMTAYGTSKLENILFTRGLERRHGTDGISAACFHPGVVGSSFGNSGGRLVRTFYGLGKRFMLSPAQGADTLVWLATTTPGVDWQSGGYYVKRRLTDPPKQAQDDTLVDRFWDASALLVS